METETQRLVRTLKDYMISVSQNGKAWYVGITNDPEKRLFNDHGVDRANGAWIYDFATAESTAREVEDYFTQQLGTQGDTGGGTGNGDCKAIYAYIITATTKQ